MRVSRTAPPLLLAFGLSVAGPIAAPGTNPADIAPTGAPNAPYLDAVRWRGLQTEAAYLRPDAPLPDREVAVPEAPGARDPASERRYWGIAAGVLLALVLAFAAWYGRGVPVSFGRARDPLRRGAAAATGAAPRGGLPAEAFLANLQALPDRRQALILLVARVLPRGWPHLDALRRLVSAAEIVHFGGRDLPEERWRDCLDRARPLFGAEKPA